MGGLVVRASRDASALAPAATRLIRGIAPQDPIDNVLTVNEIRDQSVAPRRLNAALVSSFVVLALGFGGPAPATAGVVPFDAKAFAQAQDAGRSVIVFVHAPW